MHHLVDLPRGPTGGHQGDSGQFARDLEQGVPLGVTDPPLTLPGIWPLKKELKGEDRSSTLQQRAHPGHISGMGMVEGPFSKEAAASRCGCASADLCLGPLAGIDEGDKIRTIYDGSVGGANDTIRNQTVERTTAPTVLDGVQALHWLHAAAEEGPPIMPLAPRGGSSNLHLGAGSGRSRAPGGCCSRRTSPRPTGE